MTFWERLSLFLAIGFSFLIIGVVVIPFIKPSWTFLLPEGIKCWKQASNYYSIVGGLSAAIIPVTGFYLGYLYSKRGERHEQTVYRQNRNRAFVQNILLLLDEYDDCIVSIFCSAYNDDNELFRLRHSIMQNFESIYGFLEVKLHDTIFDKEETKVFLKLNSLINNDKMLTNGSFEDLKNHEFNKLYNSYSKRFIEVRKLCITKIVHSL